LLSDARPPTGHTAFMRSVAHLLLLAAIGPASAFREESTYFYNASLLSPEYTAADVCGIDQGNVFTLGRVLPEFIEVDYKSVKSFPIPPRRSPRPTGSPGSTPRRSKVCGSSVPRI
jgi:hypothetical protein